MSGGLLCDLVAEKRGMIRVGAKGEDKWEVSEDRLSKLGDQPAGFVPVRDAYGVVARHATQLNAIQERADFRDWCYSPRPVPKEVAA